MNEVVAAYVWSRSSGRLARRRLSLSLALLPFVFPLHLLMVGLHANHLVTARGAAILVASEMPRRSPRCVCVAIVAMLIGWGGPVAASVLVAVVVHPMFALFPIVIAAVVLLDLGYDVFRHPLRSVTEEREIKQHVDSGSVRLSSLSAWPMHDGCGTNLMKAVCASLDARGRSAVLCCRPELEEWYACFGFRKNGSVLLRRPSQPGSA